MSIAVCAIPAVADESDAAAWLVERAELRHEVTAGQSVTVRNPWGNVILRVGDEGELMVLSLAQRHRDDPRVARVEAAEGEAGALVEVAYPALAIAEPVEGWERRRVDLTVLVPSAAPVSVVTTGGDVEARGLRGPLRVETGRGDVSARVGGPLVATSEHGELRAAFLSTRWQEASRLTTTTGPIIAEMPAGGNASVRFRTAGMVTTDYSVDIERDESSSHKSGTATIGAGGPLLEIESERGTIAILASLVPEETVSAPRGGGDAPRRGLHSTARRVTVGAGGFSDESTTSPEDPR